MTTKLLVPCVLGLTLVFAGGIRAEDKAGQKKGRPALNKSANISSDEMFQRLDKNDDGFLTEDELPERLKAMLDRADRDKDGKLSKREVQIMLAAARDRLDAKGGTKTKNKSNAKTKTAAKKAGQRPDNTAQVAQMIKRMDANGDGKLSKEEAQGPLARAFDRLDTNNDGVLDKDELRRASERLAAMLRDAPGGARDRFDQAANRNRPDFDAFDKDADGRLTADELDSGPIKTAFKDIDTNKDGRIDRKEFLAYHKKLEAAQKQD